MKSFSKKKASRVTFKAHRKHKAFIREEERKIPENISSIKPDDLINSNK